MNPPSAIKTDLFADEHHRKKIDSLGDPLAGIEPQIHLAALAADIDRVAPHPVIARGDRPPYPTETLAPAAPNFSITIMAASKKHQAVGRFQADRNRDLLMPELALIADTRCDSE